MKKDLEKELFSFIKGAQKAKPAFIFALPMIVYVLHRLFQRFVRLRRGLPFNRLVLAFVILTFCVTLVIMIRNIADISTEMLYSEGSISSQREARAFSATTS